MKFFNVIIFLVLALVAFGIYYFIYSKPAMMIGEKAPDIRSATIDGQIFDLSQLQGKLVLVDFWGSWCSPCRKVNPELSALYRSYKDTLHDNFQIVSIAIDDDTSVLRTAIAHDSLVWPLHIMESKSGGPITAEYKIKEIPTSYLLNESQQIIKVNPTMEELHSILKKFVAVHYSGPNSKAIPSAK